MAMALMSDRGRRAFTALSPVEHCSLPDDARGSDISDRSGHHRAGPARSFAYGRAAAVPGAREADATPPMQRGPTQAGRPSFPLSGWRDSNPRPLRPERSALPSCATPRWSLGSLRVGAGAGQNGSRRRLRGSDGGGRSGASRSRRRHGSESQAIEVSVSRVASGGQAKRTGAYGEVPSPAETCSTAPRPSAPPRLGSASAGRA
jgi:hypothetical protein